MVSTLQEDSCYASGSILSFRFNPYRSVQLSSIFFSVTEANTKQHNDSHYVDKLDTLFFLLLRRLKISKPDLRYQLKMFTMFR